MDALLATTRSSALRTALRRSGWPSSVRYAPCARLTLVGDGSVRNAATRPRIGSAAHGAVPAKSECDDRLRRVCTPAPVPLLERRQPWQQRCARRACWTIWCAGAAVSAARALCCAGRPCVTVTVLARSRARHDAILEDANQTYSK